MTEHSTLLKTSHPLEEWRWCSDISDPAMVFVICGNKEKPIGTTLEIKVSVVRSQREISLICRMQLEVSEPVHWASQCIFSQDEWVCIQWPDFLSPILLGSKDDANNFLSVFSNDFWVEILTYNISFQTNILRQKTYLVFTLKYVWSIRKGVLEIKWIVYLFVLWNR